jgi:hypothetical protein
MAQPNIIKPSDGAPAARRGSGRAKAIIAIIIIAIAVLTAVFYAVGSVLGASSGTFQSFKQAFNSAPKVYIYAEYSNGTTFSYAETCAVNLIEQVIGSPVSHRNETTMSFVQVNTTGNRCSVATLGSNGTTSMNLTGCLELGSSSPSVFISYSPTNSTVVKNNDLYVSGTLNYLAECGISAEMTSG